LNNFETAEFLKVAFSVNFGEATWNISCVELFQLLFWFVYCKQLKVCKFCQ